MKPFCNQYLLKSSLTHDLSDSVNRDFDKRICVFISILLHFIFHSLSDCFRKMYLRKTTGFRKQCIQQEMFISL